MPESQGPSRERPALDPSYGVDRAATSGMLTWETVSDKLAQARNYWVATTRPDGRPHVAPVWGVWMDGAFYFSTGAASRKGRNLAANPNVVVHLESGDDVVVLEGVAVKETDRATLERFADAYEAKYRFRPNTTDASAPVYRLRPGVGFAWLERDFPATATRWRFQG